MRHFPLLDERQDSVLHGGSQLERVQATLQARRGLRRRLAAARRRARRGAGPAPGRPPPDPGARAARGRRAPARARRGRRDLAGLVARGRRPPPGPAQGHGAEAALARRGGPTPWSPATRLLARLARALRPATWSWSRRSSSTATSRPRSHAQTRPHRARLARLPLDRAGAWPRSCEPLRRARQRTPERIELELLVDGRRSRRTSRDSGASGALVGGARARVPRGASTSASCRCPTTPGRAASAPTRRCSTWRPGSRSWPTTWASAPTVIGHEQGGLIARDRRRLGRATCARLAPGRRAAREARPNGARAGGARLLGRGLGADAGARSCAETR